MTFTSGARLLVAALLCSLLAPLAHAQEEPGEIEVRCPEGVEIELDDLSQGTSTAEGLTISHVEPGSHRLLLKRPGYKPLEVEVVVQAGQRATPEIGDFAPDVQVTETGEEPSYSIRDETGWLDVWSNPVAVTIDCPALGLEGKAKSAEEWRAYSIPPGTREFTFSAGGKKVAHSLTFEGGTRIGLWVDVLAGKVVVDPGSIEIRADEAGIEVSLDGRPAGTTTDQGLVLHGLEAGTYKVRGSKFGFKPIEEEATVAAGESSSVRISSYQFKPEVFVFEDGGAPPAEVREKLWHLVLRSEPEACTIDCYDLELSKAPKTKARWEAWGAQEKRASLTLEAESGRIYKDVQLTIGKTTVLSVYFAENRVEVDKGDLELEAAPGAVVQIDGQVRGEVPESGKVLLRDLEPGRRALHAEKPDAHPQDAEVEIRVGETTRHALRRFVPILTVIEDGSSPDPALLARASALYLTTEPQACTVACDGLAIEPIAKSSPAWVACGIPAGRHEFEFRAGDRAVRYTAEFRVGRRVRLAVDFAAGEARPLPPSVEDFAEAAVLEGHGRGVQSVACSADGRFAASVALDQTLRVWHLGSDRELGTWPSMENSTSASFSPDGRWIAAAGRYGQVLLWDVALAKQTRSLDPPAPSGSTALSDWGPGGLALASWDNKNTTISVWPTIDAQPTRLTIKESVRQIALSPDGTQVAIADASEVKVLEFPGGNELKTLGGHEDMIGDIEFSPDGQIIATASHDRTIRLWKLGSRRSIKTFTGHEDRVQDIAWSADGKWIASVDDQTLRLWNVETGQLARTLSRRNGSIHCLAFGPDGKTIVTGGLDNTVVVWRMFE